MQNTNDVLFAYVHEEINILLSVLSIFPSFYDFNLNTKGLVSLLVYLEFVKFLLGLHRNVQVFAQWNVCIFAI